MTEFPSLRRLNVSYTLVHVVYWAMFAIFAGYQTSLLLGRGFTSGEAGIFASIRCFAGILAQPLLGGWADRHPEVPIKRLLNACLVLALGVNVVFYTTRPGFWGTALIFLTLGILELNAYPLLDSMAVQFIAAGVDMSYSLSRGLGSLSYALACVACGQQAVRFGTESLLLTHMALLVLMIAVVALYPAFPKDALQAQGGGERPHSILYILKSSRPFTLTLVSLFFTLAAIMPIVSFMVNLVSDRGGDEGHLGLALFLMGASELPAALLFTPLFRRFGAAGTLRMSICFMAVKPLLFLLAPGLSGLLLVQPVQLLGVRAVHPRLGLLRQRKRLPGGPGEGPVHYDDRLQRPGGHVRQLPGGVRHRLGRRRRHAGDVPGLWRHRRAVHAGGRAEQDIKRAARRLPCRFLYGEKLWKALDFPFSIG